MASGQFLSDLSSGIFQRQRELQQQQETKDFNQQEGLVRMLAGLVDKVEDPSLLMGHIWDTMGIKKQSSGKGLRGFLDAFSGMPNRTVEDQLGTKFRELTGSFMGAGEAKGIRQRSQVAQKGLPYPGGYAPPTPGPFMDKAKADQARLDKSIVFRDPYQEKIGALEAQYKARGEHDLTMQGIRHQYNLDKQASLYDLRAKEKDEAYGRSITKARDAMALNFMMHPKVLALPPNQRVLGAKQMAQEYLMDEAQSKAGYLDAGIELRQAATGKLKSETTGPGSRASQLSAKKFAYTQSKDRMKLEGAARTAEGPLKTMREALAESEKALDSFARTFFGGQTREQMATGPYAAMQGPVGNAIRKYVADKEKLDKAQAEYEAAKKALEDYDAQYGPKQATPPPKAEKGTPPTRGTLGNVGMGSGVRPLNYQAGERAIDIRGKKQVMRGMIVPSKVDPNIRYRITYVHPDGNTAYGVIVKE